MLRTEGLCSRGQICWSTGGHTHSHIWGERKTHICYTHLMDLQAHSTDNAHTVFLCILTQIHFSFELLDLLIHSHITHLHQEKKKHVTLQTSTLSHMHTNLSRLWSFSCHDLNSCSKASSSHPSIPPIPFFPSFFFSLSSRRE